MKDLICLDHENTQYTSWIGRHAHTHSEYVNQRRWKTQTQWETLSRHEFWIKIEPGTVKWQCSNLNMEQESLKYFTKNNYTRIHLLNFWIILNQLACCGRFPLMLWEWWCLILHMVVWDSLAERYVSAALKVRSYLSLPHVSVPHKAEKQAL